MFITHLGLINLFFFSWSFFLKWYLFRSLLRIKHELRHIFMYLIFLLIAPKHLSVIARMNPCSEQICLHCKTALSTPAGGWGCLVPELNERDLDAVPALASRCLYFIHPLLQVPPEWEGLGAKLMGGRLSHPFATFHQPPPYTPSHPSFNG